MTAESSSKHSSVDEPLSKNQIFRARNSLVLPFAGPPLSFIHNAMPFFRQPSKPNIQLLTAAATQAVGQFHNSLVFTADKWFEVVRLFCSRNPLLHQIMSLSSHVQSFCQIPRRNYVPFDTLGNHNFAAVLPGDSVAGLVVGNGIMNFLNIYNTLLVVRLVLTWFPNAPPAVVSPLSTLCDPYLNIFRGIIPPLGGTLDLSPILAFLVLNAFTSAAAALPAELPSQTVVSHQTTSREKWARRLAGSKSKTSTDEN